MNCRGELKRKDIVNDYFLHPEAHVKLLNGQSKVSCTGDEITDSYFCFSFKNRKVSSNTGSFICGSYAANHFFKLLKVDKPPLFNPLQTIPTGTSSIYNSSGINSLKWDPLAKELDTALNLLIVCWDTPLFGNLLKIKRGLNNYPSYEPYFWKIETVNNVLSKDAKNRTLIKMIEDLRTNNPTLKKFSFPNINKILKEKGKHSFFG